MARYFKQDLRFEAEDLPRAPAGPLLGRQYARSAPLVAAIRSQDKIVSTSRRVVLRQGMSGATRWLVPDTDPLTGSQTHPLSGVARTVARSRFTLTPGCMLELRAIVALSGETQRAATAGEIAAGSPAYRPHGSNAEIRLVTHWDDGGATLTRTFSCPLPPSTREFGAAPTAQGEQFNEIRVVSIPAIMPQSLKSTVALRRWCQPTVVTLELQHVGGARVVDCVVVEKPYAVAMEADDGVWLSHVFGATPSGTAPLIGYPFERLSETTPDGNRRGGTYQQMDVANNQAERLGPCLLSWTSYDEDGESVTIAEAAPRIATSTSFVALTNDSITSYSNDQEGWSFAAGAYARPDNLNDPAGMPENGVIPIRVRAYCRGSDGAVNSGGVLRVQSSPYEWVDLTVSSGAAAGWQTIHGYARVGKGPGDHATAQVFYRRTTGSGGFSVWAVEVLRSGRFAPVL